MFAGEHSRLFSFTLNLPNGIMEKERDAYWESKDGRCGAFYIAAHWEERKVLLLCPPMIAYWPFFVKVVHRAVLI